LVVKVLLVKEMPVVLAGLLVYEDQVAVVVQAQLA